MGRLFLYVCTMWTKELIALLYKELLLEWKQKYAFNGLILYVMSMIVVVSLSFVDGVILDNRVAGVHILTISSHTWNIIFWLIMLFVAVNAVAKSFVGEREGNLLYLYTLAQPTAIIIAKILYNSLLLSVIGLIALFFHSLLGGTQIQDYGLFCMGVVLGSYAFAANLTLVSAIAAKAENKTTLLAVLGFPLLVPILINQIELTRKAMEGLPFSDISNKFLLSGAIAVALTLVSVVLFPFLWRD